MAEAAFKYDFGLEPAWDEICELGLQKNVADLDAYGYTIVPPEIASPDGFIERLLEACLDVSERRNGVRPDLETGYTHADLAADGQRSTVSPDTGIARVDRWATCFIRSCSRTRCSNRC